MQYTLIYLYKKFICSRTNVVRFSGEFFLSISLISWFWKYDDIYLPYFCCFILIFHVLNRLLIASTSRFNFNEMLIILSIIWSLCVFEFWCFNIIFPDLPLCVCISFVIDNFRLLIITPHFILFVTFDPKTLKFWLI